ncbi:MAG TPA: hypothetical protein VF755_25595 [Catenuloplanes sp.]|jgi:hypothetical protein
MTDGTTDYARLMRRLAALDAQLAAQRAQAEAWYAEQCAAADAAVRAAERAVRETGARVDAARRVAEVVDAEAAYLWSTFVHQVGPSAEQFGRSLPRAVVPQQRDGRQADDYLHEAQARVAPATTVRRPSGGSMRTLLALVGAVGGAVGFAAGAALRWAGQRAGGDWAVGLPVLALIVTLLGPAVGVAVAKRVADRRGSGLDPAGVAVVAIAGLATAAALLLALR